MTVVEVKNEIGKALDDLPEDVLPEILRYLNLVRQQPIDKTRLDISVKQILEEDYEVFERLAQ